MPYILDTNVLIEAKDTYYKFDVCRGFWDWLTMQNNAGNLYSVTAVHNELKKGQDELSEWAAARGSKFFLPTNPFTKAAMLKVSDAVENMQYTKHAIDEFFNAADYYVVTEACARQGIVVTREQPSDSKNRIKIPNICDELEIGCLDTFEMLYAENARFVLKSPSSVSK